MIFKNCMEKKVKKYFLKYVLLSNQITKKKNYANFKKSLKINIFFKTFFFEN